MSKADFLRSMGRQLHHTEVITESVSARPFVVEQAPPSMLAPGFAQTGRPDILVGCPRCRHTIGEEIDHGETVVCSKCDLRITMYGASLELTNAPVALRDELRETLQEAHDCEETT